MAGEKLLIFSLCNVTALFILVIRLVQQGNLWSVALRAAWKLVAAGARHDPGIPGAYPAWAELLSKTWWLMNLAFLAGWLWTAEPYYGWAALGSGAWHILWYLAGFKGVATYNRSILIDRRFGFVFYQVGQTAAYCGKSLAELDLRKKDLLVLAIERDGKMISFPKGIELIAAGDRLIMFGDTGSFQSIFMNGASG